jgi:hypothetical protein
MGSHLGAVGELSSEIQGARVQSESRNLYSRTMPAAFAFVIFQLPQRMPHQIQQDARARPPRLNAKSEGPGLFLSAAN